MPEDPLEERLAAVERAVDDGDTAATAAADRLRDRVAAVEDDVAELEAAVQAVRGYVGGVRHVNDEVEQRADAALAKAEAVERTLEVTRADGDAAAPRESRSAGSSGQRDGHRPSAGPPDSAPGTGQEGGRAVGPEPGPGHGGGRAYDGEPGPGHEASRGAGGRAEPGDGAGTDPARPGAVDPGQESQPGRTAGECPRCGSRSPPEPGSRDGETPTDDAVPGGRLPEADRPPEGLGEDAIGEGAFEDPDDEPSGGVFARLRQVL